MKKQCTEFLRRTGRSSTLVDRFLILTCNQYTGKPSWKWLELLGWSLFISYLLFVLPLIGVALHIDSIGTFLTGNDGRTGLQGYGGLLAFYGNWYFLCCMLGIPLSLAGLLLLETARNYRKNLLYEGNGHWASHDGTYHKKGFFRGISMN